MTTPEYIDAFIAPVRDNSTAQVAIAAVMLLTLVDVSFGVVGALVRHEFSSKTMRAGIGHKSASFGMMIVGDIVDGTLMGGLDLGFASPVLVAICGYLAIMEIGSVLETLARLNPDLADSPAFRLLKSVTEHDDEGASD